MPSDLLERMRRNPAGDWKFATWKPCAANTDYCSSREKDIALSCETSRRARNLDHPGTTAHQAVYIRKLVRYIEAHGGYR